MRRRPSSTLGGDSTDIRTLINQSVKANKEIETSGIEGVQACHNWRIHPQLLAGSLQSAKVDRLRHSASRLPPPTAASSLPPSLSPLPLLSSTSLEYCRSLLDCWIIPRSPRLFLTGFCVSASRSAYLSLRLQASYPRATKLYSGSLNAAVGVFLLRRNNSLLLSDRSLPDRRDVPLDRVPFCRIISGRASEQRPSAGSVVTRFRAKLLDESGYDD